MDAEPGKGWRGIIALALAVLRVTFLNSMTQIIDGIKMGACKN
jgi:hypothetical protein